MKYDQVISGQTIELVPQKFTLEACCDCGNTHFTAYWYDKKTKTIHKQAYRDDWHTKEVRFNEMRTEELEGLVKLLGYVIRRKRNKAKKEKK